MIHQGDLTIYNAADAMQYNTVIEVTGDLCVQTVATLPALTTVGGALDMYARASLPALKVVGSGLYIYARVTLPALAKVGGALVIYAWASLPALTTVGRWLFIATTANTPALTSAHGVHGRLLCVSEYGLWLGDNDLLYAGCRKGLTVAQALAYLDRQDERAIKFTAAIKALQLKETK